MDKININRCRCLRKNQTDAEKKIWDLLKNRQLLGVKFRRQFPIDKYILDFYSPEYKVGIEIDGGQHYENEGMIKDEIRARDLVKCGVQILRFNNLDVLKNIEGVYELTQKAIEIKKR